MAMSSVIMREVVVVGEFLYLMVNMMNDEVFFWVSTTTSLFEISFNHPAGQTLLAKRALRVSFKIITMMTICIMAHCITVTNVTNIVTSNSWF